MRKAILLFLIISCCFVGCTQQDRTTTSLFSMNDYNLLENQQTVKLSDIFKNYRTIALETNDSCLIGGRSNKIIKRNSTFYIQSQNSILRFDEEGHYINKLSRAGNGPEDYTSIFDFDIVTNGPEEIWISTIGGIKIYDAKTVSYKRTIAINSYVNQFKYLNKNTILTVTPEDSVFNVCNIDGSVRFKYMKKDLANSGLKPNQFFVYNNKVIYQLDNTQCGVAYSAESDSMYYQDILECNEALLTPAINRSYYEKYGYEDQYEKIKEEYIFLSTVRTLGDDVLMTKFYPDKEKVIVIGNKEGLKGYTYGKDATLENDIIPRKNLNFLSSIICCEGDNSFIFMIPAETISKDKIKDDDNPWLLECELQ